MNSSSGRRTPAGRRTPRSATILPLRLGDCILGLGLGPTLLCVAVCAAACTAPGPAFADQQEIWVLRDQRRDPDRVLEQKLRDKDPQVRLWAAQALGALRDPSAAEALATALADESTWVRHAALFSLGQLDGHDHARYLVEALDDEEASMRLVAVGGLANVGRPADVEAVTARLRDIEATVRGAAALATVRLLGDRIRSPERPPGVTSAAERTAIGDLMASLAVEKSPSARWREVYALAQLVDSAARDALLAAAGTPSDDVARAPDRWVRLFALRGLAALPPDEQIHAALLRSCDDADATLVIEAVRGLGRRALIGTAEVETHAVLPAHDDAEVQNRLAELATVHPDPHVRAEAFVALSVFRETRPDPVRSALREGLDDPAPAVRGTVLFALAELDGSAALEILGAAAQDADWRVRASAARAAARLSTEDAITLLDRLASDQDVRVRTAVLDTLAHHVGSPAAVELTAQLGQERELALRETFATTALALGDPRLVPALQDACADTPGVEAAEARKLMVRAIGQLGRDLPATGTFLRSCLDDPDPVVRREAVAQLTARGADAMPIPHEPPRELITPQLQDLIPLDLLRSRPTLVVMTEKGEFEITLLPEIAPIHCFNLLQLVHRGAYQGRIFHRVVPNFVVQGGDRRGDGFGNLAWHGGQLRDEINPLPFEAGVVGMPRTADRDTGGDQIFITTVPAPHLDGRFTGFGRVTAGMAVVEALEVGDSIRDISIRP